ncbi:hypothetical protein AB0F81_32970 [Actinoplanes sp. NPDC024001]|uniref:hypothetical protein n=1 Tax=Actinoplanes sp. NPDC024001 TaxID=3154598 RepID=UPI0033C1009E
MLDDLLRGVAAGDAEALYELSGAVWRRDSSSPATEVVPGLVRLLDSADADTAGILTLLGDIARVNPPHEPVAAAVAAGLPVYLRLLAAHPDEFVRAVAAGTIGGLGPDVAGGASAALRQAATGDTSVTVRACAVLALADREENVEQHLGDPAPLARLAAALTAAGTNDARTILERDAPACLNDIAGLPRFDDNPLIWVLRELRPHWELQADLVTTWLRHPDPAVREDAAYAAEEPLMLWRPAAERLAPALAAAVADPDKKVRYWAVRNLASAGRAAAGYADQLAAAVEQDREAPAVEALARLGDPRADEYLAGVLRSLPEADLNRLDGAFDALGPWAVRTRAVVLGAIDAAPARLLRAAHRMETPAGELVPVLRREAGAHPYAVVPILGDLGPAAVDALPELAALRHSTDVVLRIEVERAVWRITGSAGELLATLRAEIGNRHALAVLAELGPAGAALAGQLPPMFDSGNEWQALRAAVAYWHVTGDPEPVVPVLLRHLVCSPRGMIAVKCLGDIGPAAGAAEPVLRAAVESPYRQWRTSVGEDGIRQDEAWSEACAAALARVGGFVVPTA